MAAPVWVAAVLSDDDDDDDYVQVQQRGFPVATPNALSKGELYVIEDDDVQVLNVLKHELGSRDRVPFSGGRAAAYTLRETSPGGQIHHFSATEALGLQQSEISLKRRRKDEARFRRRLRVWDSCGEGPASHLNREQGVLGGGLASQMRSQQGLHGGSALQFRAHQLVVGGTCPVPPFCERILAAQANKNGGSLDHGLYCTLSAPDHGLLGRERAPGPPNLEMTLIGNTMNEWWNSLQASVGREISLLHWDIVNFCKAYELTSLQMQVRRESLEYVECAVQELWPSAEVHLFGSTATGLALPWSDIDVAVIFGHHQKPSTVSLLSALGRQLKRHGQCQSLKQISHAKVPLLKVVLKSGICCDISFDASNGPRSVLLIRHFMLQFEAARPLCLVLKFFLGQRCLNELFTGGLGSFCLVNMVVSHLQKLGLSGAGHDLGVLLLSFFTRYSIMHNYRTDVVSTRTEFCASKEAKGWMNFKDPERLAVEDPLDPTSDIARGSYRIGEIRAKFLRAQRMLITHWREHNVLAQILDTSGNPNQRPKPQMGQKQVTGGTKQKKRKKHFRIGVDQEDAQQIRGGKKRKVNSKHPQQRSNLAVKSSKKHKYKQKRKEWRAAGTKDSQVFSGGADID